MQAEHIREGLWAATLLRSKDKPMNQADSLRRHCSTESRCTYPLVMGTAAGFSGWGEQQEVNAPGKQKSRESTLL